MRRKSAVLAVVPGWERRRYWRGNVLTDVEVWRGGRLLPTLPRRIPAIAISFDYCETHRTRIYSDLPCQFCGERPAPLVVEHAGTLRVDI